MSLPVVELAMVHSICSQNLEIPTSEWRKNQLNAPSWEGEGFFSCSDTDFQYGCPLLQ